MPTVTQVRKELASDGVHRHIAGVCASNTYYARQQVVEGIRRGEDWHTYANGRKAPIREIRYCPAAGCPAMPYITTRPDDSRDDNLENLPLC